MPPKIDPGSLRGPLRSQVGASRFPKSLPEASEAPLRSSRWAPRRVVPRGGRCFPQVPRGLSTFICIYRFFARASRALESFSFAFAPMEKPAEAGQKDSIDHSRRRRRHCSHSRQRRRVDERSDNQSGERRSEKSRHHHRHHSIKFHCAREKRSRNHPIT